MILILLAKTCCLCSWFTNWDDTWLHETQLRTSHRQFSQETVQLTATLTPSRPNEKRTTCPFGKRFTWRIRQETDSLPQSHPETTTWLSHMRYPVRTNKRKLKCTIYVYIYIYGCAIWCKICYIIYTTDAQWYANIIIHLCVCPCLVLNKLLSQATFININMQYNTCKTCVRTSLTYSHI